MPNNFRKRRASLPSPPLSSLIPKATRPGISPSEGSGSVSRTTRRVESPNLHDSGQSWKKRRRDADEQASPDAQGHCQKRRKEDFGSGQEQDSDLCENTTGQDPLQYWASTGEWPKNFGQMSEPKSDGPNKRSRSSTTSYSSRARDGSVPPAHTAAYEEELRRYGIMFDDWTTKHLVTSESMTMCQALLNVDELAPAYNFCSKESYERLFARATKCNEERIRRDLTPHIVPSAELLYVIDGETTLKHVREEMSGDWTKCNLLGGTQPRPDYAYGLSSATFTEEERAKLENYTNIDNPTKFTESMFFPFLMCEAKCGRKNINDADRQNAHSASIAVNAIIRLCQAVGEEFYQSLSGQILVFSVSHDNERAKIFGHFPIIRDGCITFNRYCVHDYILNSQYGRDRNTGSNFTRAVYRDFYPVHLARIRRAIEYLPDPRVTATVSDTSVDEGQTQASGQSSQAWGAPPNGPIRRAKSRGSQLDLTLMKEQMISLEQQREDSRKQLEQLREDNRKQLEQLRELREDNRKQLEQQREDNRKQLEQQREDNRKQLEQQREDSQKQLEQQREASQKQSELLERLLGQRHSS